MSIKKFVYAWIVCIIVFAGIDFTWHLVIFASYYHSLKNTLTNQTPNYLLLVANDVYRGFIFSLVYTIFVKKHGSLFRGLLFGLCIGLLMASVTGLYFAFMPLSQLRWLYLEAANLLIQAVIAGIFIPVVCWGGKAKTNSVGPR